MGCGGVFMEPEAFAGTRGGAKAPPLRRLGVGRQASQPTPVMVGASLVVRRSLGVVRRLSGPERSR